MFKRIPNIISKQLATYSSYMRNNGKFQRREQFQFDVVANTMSNMRVNSIEDWRNVRQAIINHEYNRGQLTTENIDAMILGHCTSFRDYNLGSSYINYLKQENITPNLATRSRHVKLLYFINEHCLINGKFCPEDQEKLILNNYEDLRKKYPVLDSFTLENLVTALCVTSQWKQSIEIMKEIKVASVPNQASYSALISAAFAHKEEDLAWQYLNEMLENNRTPQSICFLTYLGTIAREERKEKRLEKLEILFSFFQENDFMCERIVAKAIADFGKQNGFANNFTAVTHQGVCRSCRSKLDCFDLEDDEFDQLKQNIFKNIIVGKDVFVRTNPEELQKFTGFVQNMGKYDVVLDGLNVAYSAGTKQSPYILSGRVAAVVSHFVNKNKKVLVLGRVHMNNWPRQNWGYVNDNATVFLTQNISQDDPYLLYCALNSGKDTIIVTRDLMRGHKFLLRNAKDKILFNRWLSQRQYQLVTVDDNRKPIFRAPPAFSLVTQKNGSTWHIPYTDETAVKNKQEFHKTWLCLKLK